MQKSLSISVSSVVLLRFFCVLPLGHTRPSVVSGFHRARSMAGGVGTCIASSYLKANDPTSLDLELNHSATSSVCTACVQGGRDSILYCFWPRVDSPSKPQWGSILLLFRALAPCSIPLL